MDSKNIFPGTQLKKLGSSVVLIYFILVSRSTAVLTITLTVASAFETVEPSTTTQIRHLVVIFQENVPFDHYFGTYPHASNPAGEPQFLPSPGTPVVNNLITSGLLTDNPNVLDPFRLDRSIAVTNDNNHSYTIEQRAYNGGRMDKFVENNIVIPNYLSSEKCLNSSGPPDFNNACLNPTQVMGYYDGNTVTALWNYAQHFAMSDNFFQINFGKSIPGHINLISGQTHGAIPENDLIHEYTSNGTILGDADPLYDDCSFTPDDTFFVPWLNNTAIPNTFKPAVEMTGKNIGDLLNIKNITWGWFSAGFQTASENGDNCNSVTHDNGRGIITYNYVPSVEPFQYYKSNANPHHLPPSSTEMIGQTDQANHQYDLSDFWNAAENGNLPSVSFIKAPTYQQGHAGYSGPLLDQAFLVNTLNRFQKLSQWNNSLVIITYDDSDGWYDHINASNCKQLKRSKA